MTDILHSPSQLPSSSSSIATNNDGFHQQTHFLNHETLIINCNNDNNNVPVALYRRRDCTSREIQQLERGEEEEEEGEDQLSVLAVLLTVFRKSLVGCRNTSGENTGVEEQLMEIGWPTNVRHVAHVTFDRFNGFLGLPDEFEPEVPRMPPSASTRVFGVSTESMQLSFDSRGNCVPTILLMMQRRLYMQGGLQSEGIFRINPENSQEEYVREQLNNGVIPDNIDVHCLAGLIKAWFRELPSGVLDSLPPEQVMEAQSEDECAKLVRLLPPTEGALLDWAINLMADVAQLESFNKMNARNIAMVFAPNMTQMSDPLTALMFAVQVMNFLKTLIVKTLREREDYSVESGPMLQSEHSDEDDRYTISKPENPESNEISCEENELTLPKEPEPNQTGNETHGFLSSIENILPEAKAADAAENAPNSHGKSQPRSRRTRTSPHSNLNNVKKESRKHNSRPVVHVNDSAEKKKELSIISCMNSHTERVETWR